MNRVKLLAVFCVLLCSCPALIFASDSGKVDVFVSIPPQKWLCEQVGKDLVKVQVLIEKGQEPHTFEPRPHQILELSNSSILFGAGLVFEKGLVQRMGHSFLNFRIVDTTEKIHKIPMQGAENKKGEMDPHVWLSPLNLKRMAASMAENLAVEDPENAAAYENNLSELNRQLDDLDREIGERLAPFQGASFLVFHPAFGYFADRYKLHQVAVEVGGRSPTPRKLAALIGKARKEKIRVVFVQPQFDPKSANVVANAIHGRVVPMNPLAENAAENLRIMSERIAEGLREK